MFIGFPPHKRQASEADQLPWQTLNAWLPDEGGWGRIQAFRPPAGANIYHPIPLSMSWLAIVACVAMEGYRRPPFIHCGHTDMELGVLDPQG